MPGVKGYCSLNIAHDVPDLNFLAFIFFHINLFYLKIKMLVIYLFTENLIAFNDSIYVLKKNPISLIFLIPAILKQVLYNFCQWGFACHQLLFLTIYILNTKYC